MACAQIVARRGLGVVGMSAGSALLGVRMVRSARFISRCVTPTARTSARERRSLDERSASPPAFAFVTQNGLYDWGWLRTDLGVTMPPSDQLEEILALATLIDENRFSYSLDSLCTWRGLPGKDETLLRQAVEAAGFKISKKTPPQSYIHKLPARFVGPYAEADATNTLALRASLDPVLDKEGTRAAYRLEIDLLPMVHEMRRRGVRVDQSAAEQGRDYCLQKRDAALVELSEQLGSQVSMAETASSNWKKRTFDAHGIDYPRTEKGNPSFKAGKLGWMAKHPHWLPRLIATASKYNFAGSTFLQGHILEHLIGDRIYGEINPFRSEEGGTKSFRFSYSNPPLQQMPSRDKELGPLIRRVFLPEEGESLVRCRHLAARISPRCTSRLHPQPTRRRCCTRTLPHRPRHRFSRAHR